MLPRLAKHVLVLAAVGLGGCYGKSSVEEGGAGSANAPGAGAEAPGAPGSGCGPACDPAGVASRFSRLTHAQWENSVVELLELEAPSGLASTLTSDVNAGIFDTHIGGLRIGGTLWADYQRTAETLAQSATADLATLQRILPADFPDGDLERASRFIQHLGLRAFRRPITAGELDAFMGLYARGTELTGVSDPLLAGARIVLQALLQSPFFLYRVELSEAVDAHGRILLDDYEIASRLSFALWNAMPDDVLLGAAAAGELSTTEGVAAQATRMLESERARAMLLRFHHQLFDLDQLDHVQPDPSMPELTANFGRSLEHEAELFVDDVVFAKGEGLNSLLLSTHTFANRELAAVYGIEGTFTDEAFERVELDPTRRSGLLTRAGFMAAYGHGASSDPIRRGVFVNLRLLCSDLPDPPNNVTPLPASEAPMTMRDRVSGHTGDGTCGEGCHSIYINPVGFAFEHYDGLGRFRTEDNGFPVNAADSFEFPDTTRITYTDALTFSSELAKTAQTHHCYAKHWVEYFFGREALETDEPVIQRLMKASLEEAPVKDLLLTLVTSPTFLTRAPEVTP